MKAIDNKKAACMNRVWKKLWPEECTDILECDEEIVPAAINDIIELASEWMMQNVNAEDVEELLQYHSESVSIEELQELAQQRIQNEPKHLTVEEPVTPERILTFSTLNSLVRTSPRLWKS